MQGCFSGWDRTATRHCKCCTTAAVAQQSRSPEGEGKIHARRNICVMVPVCACMHAWRVMWVGVCVCVCTCSAHRDNDGGSRCDSGILASCDELLGFSQRTLVCLGVHRDTFGVLRHSIVRRPAKLKPHQLWYACMHIYMYIHVYVYTFMYMYVCT
jgi:hypothetical protein